MKDLDLTSLRYFVAACETGNITRAAEQEHVVASAISKRLAQLEADLTVPLLVRQRRGVVPTPAGEVLLEHARAILADASRIAQDVASFGSGVRGQVRLLATVSSIEERLPDDVAEFMQMPEHRQIRVDIDETLSRDILRRIREGGASLGVLWDAAAFENLQHVPYRNDQLALIAWPEHPLAARKRCTFEETLLYEHVGLQASTAVNMMLSRAAAQLGMPLNYRTRVSNFHAALRAVKARLGVCIVPREVAAQYADLLGLLVLPLRDPWARRRFAICYRERESLSKAALLLLDHLAGKAKEAG